MNRLSVLFHLILAHNRKRWVRMLLGILGLAVSVCLVIWIVRGYDAAVLGEARAASQKSRFNAVVSPPSAMPSPGQGRGRPQQTSAPRFVEDKWIQGLKEDSSVSEVLPVIRNRIRQIVPAPPPQAGPFGGASLIGLKTSTPIRPVEQGEWLDPSSTEDNQAVITDSYAKRNKLKLGSTFTVGGVGGEAELVVRGILGGASVRGGPESGDIFTQFAAAAKVNGYQDRYNAIFVILKDGDTVDDFVESWLARMETAEPPVTIQSLNQQEDMMAGRMMVMVKMQAQNAKVLGFLAAAFVIFITLSSGVRERLRELASLRAIAMSRKQVVALIFLEAFLLSAMGWGLGVLLAKSLLKLGTALAVKLRFFQAGAFADHPLGWETLGISALCALLGSLAAAIPNAWTASRVRPMDILGAPAEPMAKRFPWKTVIVGLILVCTTPAMVLLVKVEPFRSFFSKTYSMGFAPPLLSTAATMLGLALITPLILRIVEKLFAPMIGMLFRLDPRLLRKLLTANLKRTVGTTIALSAGLTLFVTALVWGYSMLVPFTPDESLPRMLVSILPAGLPEEALDEVGKTDGVVAGQSLPVAVEQPRLTEEALALPAFSTVNASQQHLLFMGVAPDKAFGGEHPILNFDFLEGNREEAARKLKEGRYCLVPDHFATQTGLSIGDKVAVSIPNSEDKASVEYEIAGVVYVPGWNWFTKFSEIRRRAGRALAVVFADYDLVKSDFKLDRISYFWMNVDKDVSFQAMEKRLTPLANKYANVTIEVPGTGPAWIKTQYVKITERSDLTARLFNRADSVIWSLTHFPLVALIIASLAVFNTIFASVHARFWQFGVLRGVGLSGGQLFRVIFSESLLIFLAASLLSFGSGVLLAWCGTHICTEFFYFAGRTPPTVLPWSGLSLGFGIVFFLCVLAGLIPALRMIRREPLSFIQGGRLSG